MPKISKDAGPSYFPEGAIIRDTDDPALVALARDKGATVIDPGNREPHEVLEHGRALDAKHRAESEQQNERDERPVEQERDENESRTVGNDDAQTVNYPDSGTQTAAGDGNWTRARSRDEQ